MSQYPVESQEQLYQAINYLLSGPSGLGQNFAGFSSYAVAYLTGNYRTPFTQPTTRNLYVPAFSLATSEFVDGRTLRFTFAAAQPSPPFNPGDQVIVAGVSNSWYDYKWNPVGVVSCTTTECLVRTGSIYTPPFEPIGYGGTIGLSAMNADNSTDCNARVTVTGGTDRVFISGQLDQLLNYEVISGTQNLAVKTRVNRYSGFINEDPVNPDYLFAFDGTVAEKAYSFTGLTGTGTLPLIETVYSTLLDTPPVGYYWYILEVAYEGSDIEITSAEFGLRSLSAQVVKQ